MSAGRVNQALSGAIRQVLKDYFVFVAELEAQHRRGQLTLNKIWFAVQAKLETMSLMAFDGTSLTQVLNVILHL